MTKALAGAAIGLALSLASIGGASAGGTPAEEALAKAEFDKAEAEAPGGPWRLVAVNDNSIMLVKAEALDKDGASASGWVLTILRRPKVFAGIGEVYTLEAHSQARCSDDAERSLRIILKAPDGKVAADAGAGLRPDFKLHEEGSLYTLAMHALCNPAEMDDYAGYPDEETALRMLMPNGPGH